MLTNIVKKSNLVSSNKKYTWILHFIPISLILIFCMYYIKDNMMIKIVGDEYGYWASGAYFAGYDWSGITSFNSYYSFGYGLWLAMILILDLPAITAYRIALFLNVIFLCGIYFVVYKIIDKYSSMDSSFLKVSISFMIAVYTSNFYYTQYTMAEVLIAFLYWLIIYLALKLLEKVTITRAMLFVFLLVYLFFVHQRTVGVCFVSAVLLMYILIRDKTSLKKYILYASFLVIIMFIFLSLKEIYQYAFFDGGQGANLSGNDFSGQVSKLEYIMSLNGLWMFIKAYVGKIFYALSSTNMLAGIAVIIAFLESIKCAKNVIIKRRKVDIRTVFLIYLVLNVAAMMAVGSIFMANYYARFDVLIYGRYFDFTLSPLIMVALLYMIRGNKKTLLYCISGLSGLYIIMAILIDHILVYQTDFSNVFINCPGVADTVIFLEYQQDVILWAAFKSIFACLLLTLLIMQSKKINIIKSFIIIGFATLSMTCDIYVYKEGCLSWAIEQNLEEISLAEYIYENGMDDRLYYYAGDSVVNGDYLQFLLKDSTIKSFYDINQIKDLTVNEYILTSKNSDISIALKTLGYEIIEDSTVLDLWRKMSFR